jgi:hypothetical protein
MSQPVGVGFTTAAGAPSFIHNETQLADSFYVALQHWFDVFHQYRPLPLFLFGESYAGHYVPAIAARIQQGRKAPNEANPINLVGVTIGNGWVDPTSQGASFLPYALSRGLIDYQSMQQLKQTWEQCHEDRALRKYVEMGIWPSSGPCSIMQTICKLGGGVNMYDVNVIGSYALFGTGPMNPLAQWVARVDVQLALNIIGAPSLPTLPTAPSETVSPASVEPLAWAICNNTILDAFDDPAPGHAGDAPRTLVPDLGSLLDDGIDVLIYAGESTAHRPRYRTVVSAHRS